MELMQSLILIGVIIIGGLTVIAARLVYKLFLIKKAQAKKLEAQTRAYQAALEVQRSRTNQSIQILALAVQQNELSLTEACVRICGLLDQLGINESTKDELGALYDLRRSTQHIPILADWQQLSLKEQNAFELERLRHEQHYQDVVFDSLHRLIGRNF